MDSEMKKEIVKFLQEQARRLNKPTIAGIPVRKARSLLDMVENYSRKYDGPALYRCIEWYKENEATMMDECLATLVHDFNGFLNEEKFFSPRSESF